MKSHSYKFLLLFILFALVGCGSQEETKQSDAAKGSKDVETTEKEKEENQEEEYQEEENQEAEVAIDSFQILETVKDFGGGTFNVNNELNDANEIYITESNEEIFLNFYNQNRMVVSGNKDGWQSISNESENNFGSNSGVGATNRYVRGNTYYEEKDDLVTFGKLKFDDVDTITKGNNPIAKEGRLFLVNTSKGEGVIIKNEDKYTLYIDGEAVLQFDDAKEMMREVSSQTQYPYEAKNYVDIEHKKLFFADQYGNYVYVLDLETGKPLFEDGELKGIQLSDDVDIIGDDNGNLYIFQADEDRLLLGVFNSNLDFLTEFSIPVENANDFSVTKTKDEFHIWSRYEYEMDPMLELVKISRPIFSNNQ